LRSKHKAKKGKLVTTVLNTLMIRSYVTTGGQSGSLSWCQAPIWGPRPDSYYCQTVCCCWAPSLTRGRICNLQLLLVFASIVTLLSGSRGTHDHILLIQTRDSPNLEGQVPVFTSPRNRAVKLYPQVLGSLFVVPYDSHGYGGSFPHRKHITPPLQNPTAYCC
jgi:hypothetical protein